MHIVDRRLNPSGKNLANRQRFMRRAKSLIRKAVHESSASRSIKDADQAGEVALPAQGVHEPAFHRAASGGTRDHLLPGNKQYVEGDTIPRPQGGSGGVGSEGSPDGDGQDDFRFALSRDEFVDLFLDDLELPDALRSQVNPRFKARVCSILAGGQSVMDLYDVDFPFDGQIVAADATFVAGASILIGTHLLRAYRLEIDFPNSRVQLDRVI